MLPQALDHFAVGMAVAVFEAHRDHGERRVRRRSRNSSVLEVWLPWCATLSTSVRAQFVVFQHAALDRPLHVAAQQERMAAVAQAQHQRIVVLGRVARERNPASGASTSISAPPKAKRAGACSGTILTPFCAALRRAARARWGCRAWRRSTTPAGGNRPTSAGRPPMWSSCAWESATTSTVRMRAVPQVGRHHVFADIELRRATGGRKRGCRRHPPACACHRGRPPAGCRPGRHRWRSSPVGPGWCSGGNGCHSSSTRKAATAPPAAARHQRPRATAAAISAAEKRHAQPQRRSGNAPVGLDGGVPAHHPLREPQQHARRSSPPTPIR